MAGVLTSSGVNRMVDTSTGLPVLDTNSGLKVVMGSGLKVVLKMLGLGVGLGVLTTNFSNF